MYALQLASERPSALVDWNNNYGNDPDKCVLFHCGNWAKEFLPDIRIGTAPILGTILGEENTVGALEGRTPSGPMAFGRISTDDATGDIHAYVGDAYFTDDPLKTFGTRAVAQVARLRELMQCICLNGFEHHAAINASHCAAPVDEALGNYLGWKIYRHTAEHFYHWGHHGTSGQLFVVRSCWLWITPWHRSQIKPCIWTIQSTSWNFVRCGQNKPRSGWPLKFHSIGAWDQPGREHTSFHRCCATTRLPGTHF
jgi:hypothetical protein